MKHTILTIILNGTFLTFAQAQYSNYYKVDVNSNSQVNVNKNVNVSGNIN